jgi:DNA-binding MarR family transcriptional regulator
MSRSRIRNAELVGLKIVKVSESLQRASAAIFKDNDLSAPQYNVLRILRGAAAAPLSCQEIATRMIKRVPDITRLLDRLVARKLVDRSRCEDDRRVVRTVITPAGLDLLAAIDGPLRRQVHDNFRRLPQDELEQLDRLLDLLDAGIAESRQDRRTTC